MADATKEVFNYAYDLKFVVLPFGGLNFQIVDDDKTKPGLNPAAADITVKDPNGGGVATNQNLNVTKVGLGDLDIGKYTFIGSGSVVDSNAPGGSISGIIVEDNASGKFYLLTDTAVSNLKSGNGLTTVSSGTGTIGEPVCFMAGTLIRTPDGEAAVETLKPGSQVLTHDGRVATVDWLGIQTISLRFTDKLRALPIRIRAGALGDNVPARDLLISPDHAVLVEGALVHAGALVNGTSIVRESDVPTTFSYYHVEVEDHSLILAENTPAETFVDNVDRLQFDNWAEHEALYPDGKPITELPYPRAKSHRQVPVATRVMLASRAQKLVGGLDRIAAA